MASIGTITADVQLGDNLARVTALQQAVEYHGNTDTIPLSSEVVETAEAFHRFLTAGQADA